MKSKPGRTQKEIHTTNNVFLKVEGEKGKMLKIKKI